MIAETARILEFLDGEGLTRVKGEPFSFCHYGTPIFVVSIDEEYTFVDLHFLIEDRDASGASDFADRLLGSLGVTRDQL